MKMNNIFRFVWSMAVLSAMFLSCTGEYPEIGESVNGEDPSGSGQQGENVTPPVQWNGGDVTVTLDFTAGWPFEEACVAASSQADKGEFYKFAYTSSDATSSIELDFGIQKGQKSSTCTHSYSYSDKALSFDNSAGSGAPSAGGGSTYGLINIPGIEGKYLSKMVIHHNGAEYFTITAGENFAYNASPNASTAQDSQNPLIVNFPFSNVEAVQGAPYNIRLRVAGVKISKIELYYTVALPQVQGPDLTGIHHFAHRGAWSQDSSGAWVIPENSITGIQQAALMGYEGIELDVRYTSDGKMVVMHDGSINRTMRNAADYTELSATVNVASTTFEDLRTKYVLESTVPSFRRQIPTLEEMLLECRRLNIRPMLHSAIEESYKLAQDIVGDNWVCFNADYDLIKSVRGYSNCTILWSIDSDDAAKGDVLEKLAAIGGDCGISSVDEPLYTQEFIASLKDAGYHVQSSIFSPAAKELEAIENGIDYLLTDRIKPAGSAEKGSVVDDALKNPGSGHEDFTTVKPALDLSDGLQVLAIGNSFSVDAMEYLHGVLTDAGYENVTLGNMYIGGCSLEKHATNFSADKADYTYYKNTTGTWVTTKTTAPSTALLDEKWDYIMMQQVSQNSGMPETFDPYLENLIDMVTLKCPDARLMWHMTWAYQGDSTHSGFANYGKDQMTMYNAIVNAVKTRILTDVAFEKVIPCGTAVQNMRTSYYGDKLTRDGYHMSTDVGRFLTALTFAKALTGCSLNEITYRPSEHTYTDELISAMKDAANKACEKPYEVTASAYPAM